MTTEIQNIKKNAKEQIRAIKNKAKADVAQLEKNLSPKRYTLGEEIFNSVTHGIAVLLSIAALVILIVRAVFNAPVNQKGFYVTGVTVYGTTLIILYLMSTLYHALTPYNAKKVFAVFDHSSIYLLIAGTYTPFCLGVLRNSYGWLIFGIIWGLTVFGITMYAVLGNKLRAVSAITYVIMGWLIMFAWKALNASVSPLVVRFLILGGVAYTVGVIFYALKKVRWMHCVWHLFVIAGSILHFFAVYYSI